MSSRHSNEKISMQMHKICSDSTVGCEKLDINDPFVKETENKIIDLLNTNEFNKISTLIEDLNEYVEKQESIINKQRFIENLICFIKEIMDLCVMSILENISINDFSEGFRRNILKINQIENNPMGKEYYQLNDIMEHLFTVLDVNEINVENLFKFLKYRDLLLEGLKIIYQGLIYRISKIKFAKLVKSYV